MQEHSIITKRYTAATKKTVSSALKICLAKKFTYVSISHKQGVIVGLGSTVPCGIDLEVASTKQTSFATFVCSASEHIFAIDPVLHWSIKEACFKVHNDGYEPADFTVVQSSGSGIYVVRSKHYTYTVTSYIQQGLVQCQAFVTPSKLRYS